MAVVGFGNGLFYYFVFVFVFVIVILLLNNTKTFGIVKKKTMILYNHVGAHVYTHISCCSLKINKYVYTYIIYICIQQTYIYNPSQ